MIVVDASAIGSFLLPDEASAFASFAEAMCLNEDLHAPPHWSVEVANLIRKAERHGRLNQAQAIAAAERATAIGATLFEAAAFSVRRLAQESRRTGLTSYDAAYLLLAKSLDAPLLTEDGKLRRAAAANGIETVAP